MNIKKIIPCLVMSGLLMGSSSVILANLDDSVALQIRESDHSSIIRLNQATIQNKASQLKSAKTWNTVARYGVKGVAGLAALFLGYKILSGFGGGAAKDSASLPEGAIPDNANLHKRMLERELQCNKHEALISPSFFSLQYFKHLSVVLGEHLILGATANAIYQASERYLGDKVFYPESIGWFVHTKTNLMTSAELIPIVVPMELVMGSAMTLGQLGGIFQKDLTVDQRTQLGKYAALMIPQNNLRKSIFEELKGYAAALGDATNPGLDKQPVVLIVSACNNLVNQIESILGYIEYKKSYMTGNAENETASAVRYVFNATGEFCSKMETLLNDSQLDCQARKSQTETVINSFKNDIGRILISFARIESALDKK